MTKEAREAREAREEAAKEAAKEKAAKKEGPPPGGRSGRHCPNGFDGQDDTRYLDANGKVYPGARPTTTTMRRRTKQLLQMLWAKIGEPVSGSILPYSWF